MTRPWWTEADSIKARLLWLREWLRYQGTRAFYFWLTGGRPA